MLKSLLIYAIWFAANIEDRGSEPMTIGSWNEVRVDYGYYHGIFNSSIKGPRKIYFVEPKLGRKLMAMPTFVSEYGSVYDWKNRIYAKQYKTPWGYAFTDAEVVTNWEVNGIFWLDEFDER